MARPSKIQKQFWDEVMKEEGICRVPELSMSLGYEAVHIGIAPALPAAVYAALTMSIEAKGKELVFHSLDTESALAELGDRRVDVVIHGYELVKRGNKIYPYLNLRMLPLCIERQPNCSTKLYGIITANRCYEDLVSELALAFYRESELLRRRYRDMATLEGQLREDRNGRLAQASIRYVYYLASNVTQGGLAADMFQKSDEAVLAWARQLMLHTTFFKSTSQARAEVQYFRNEGASQKPVATERPPEVPALNEHKQGDGLSLREFLRQIPKDWWELAYNQPDGPSTYMIYGWLLGLDDDEIAAVADKRRDIPGNLVHAALHYHGITIRSRTESIQAAARAGRRRKTSRQ